MKWLNHGKSESDEAVKKEEPVNGVSESFETKVESGTGPETTTTV